MHGEKTMEELIIHGLNWQGQRHIQNPIIELFAKTKSSIIGF